MPVLAFVFICVMLMPFGLGPELSLLQRLAPGLLWVIMLMAVLLSLDRMFQADFEDGGLDQLMLLPVALEGAVMAKLAAHFVGILMPVLATMPLAGLLLNIRPDTVIPCWRPCWPEHRHWSCWEPLVRRLQSACDARAC